MNLRLGDPFFGDKATAAVRTITPVLLNGAGGTGLWALARRDAAESETTPFQDIASGLKTSGFRAPIVVTSATALRLVARQLTSCAVEPQRLIIEPAQRGAAAAVLAAALEAERDDPEAVLLILTGRAGLHDGYLNSKAIALGLSAVAQGRIVTFGVTADGAGADSDFIAPADDYMILTAARDFVTRADRQTARDLAGSRDYLAHSGIILAKASVILAEAESRHPKLLRAVRSATKLAGHDGVTICPDTQAWLGAPSLSASAALLTGLARVDVVRLSAGWGVAAPSGRAAFAARRARAGQGNIAA